MAEGSHLGGGELFKSCCCGDYQITARIYDRTVDLEEVSEHVDIHTVCGHDLDGLKQPVRARRQNLTMMITKSIRHKHVCFGFARKRRPPMLCAITRQGLGTEIGSRACGVNTLRIDRRVCRHRRRTCMLGCHANSQACPLLLFDARASSPDDGFWTVHELEGLKPQTFHHALASNVKVPPKATAFG